MARRGRTLAFVALFVSVVGWPTAQAATPPPADWPNTSVMIPSLDGWPNAIRLSGANRYQTGLAAALTLRGAGGPASYPFGSPDPATAAGWFGLDSCPRAIIVVAGDNPADALAATPLSDPTGESSEPYLSISASADQVFDPIGDFRRVDTDFAPILTTTSTRQGATELNVATRLAAQDLRSGGCTTARDAIVVGGTSAVPASVDTELVSIGYDRVYRVAGTSRYNTAQLVAMALGTTAAPTGASQCADAVVNDGSARMDFYANSVVEYRSGVTSCMLFERTVVLADGLVGADALAAGWWTSYWQVPVLLHNGTKELPSATRQALQTIGVENVIVLGGTSRISDAVVSEILSVTSATVTRVSGADRYATSTKMAEVFGGWFDTSNGSDFAGSKVCIAASSGGSVSNAGNGWADALVAGPWCARSAASNIGAPVRALAPSNGSNPMMSSAAQLLARPAREAIPIILVPAGVTTLPDAIESFFTTRFQPSTPWCSSAIAAPGCEVGGFAVVFGGDSVIKDSLIAHVSTSFGGGASFSTDERDPALTAPFVTSLDLSPVFDDDFGSGLKKVCFLRSSYSRARWLVVGGVTESASNDVMMRGRYASDPDGVIRSPGAGSPACVAAPAGDEVVAWASSMSGHRSLPVTLVTGTPRRITMSSTISAIAPASASGVDSNSDASGGGFTTWSFRSTEALQLTRGPEVFAVTQSAISLTLTRGLNSASVLAPDQFTGTFSLISGPKLFTGTIAGEGILDGSTWRIRGRATWVTEGAEGGFSADLDVGPTALTVDDSAVWGLDGLIS
jgi:putative cell wall-binding protein